MIQIIKVLVPLTRLFCYNNLSSISSTIISLPPNQIISNLFGSIYIDRSIKLVRRSCQRLGTHLHQQLQEQRGHTGGREEIKLVG